MDFKSFFNEHRWTILLCLGGLILAVLFFTIGFWRTIVLFLILAACFFLGSLLDRGGISGLKSFFKDLFRG